MSTGSSRAPPPRLLCSPPPLQSRLRICVLGIFLSQFFTPLIFRLSDNLIQFLSFWLLVMSRRRILMKDLIKKNRRHSGLLLKLLAGVATFPSNCRPRQNIGKHYHYDPPSIIMVEGKCIRFEDVNLPDIFFMGIEYFSDISENFNDLSASRRSSDSVFATKESGHP
ncbi:uncharacterized protein [Aegilops tauschii subsp. strangulata]|uniref:uncharacterized protein isoform X2 n=1 Tax=Aegilops tauschii subsp. strangulata TaxID=200361 RepID=UPI00098ABC16|nr:uncharacterized protein LOC109742756 isoform X2 [Aegilops tauschii subsp. strangulata]